MREIRADRARARRPQETRIEKRAVLLGLFEESILFVVEVDERFRVSVVGFVELPEDVDLRSEQVVELVSNRIELIAGDFVMRRDSRAARGEIGTRAEDFFDLKVPNTGLRNRALALGRPRSVLSGVRKRFSLPDEQLAENFAEAESLEFLLRTVVLFGDAAERRFCVVTARVERVDGSCDGRELAPATDVLFRDRPEHLVFVRRRFLLSFRLALRLLDGLPALRLHPLSEGLDASLRDVESTLGCVPANRDEAYAQIVRIELLLDRAHLSLPVALTPSDRRAAGFLEYGVVAGARIGARLGFELDESATG